MPLLIVPENFLVTSFLFQGSLHAGRSIVVCSQCQRPGTELLVVAFEELGCGPGGDKRISAFVDNVIYGEKLLAGAVGKLPHTGCAAFAERLWVEGGFHMGEIG